MKARSITKKAVSAAAAAAMALSGTGIGSGAVWANAAASDYDYTNLFTFTDSGISAEYTEGTGYKIEGTELTINAAGTYVVSGDCAEGSITVKKNTAGVVLVLSDIRLASSETSPLKIGKGASAEVVIDGTDVLTDNEDPANEDSADAETADAFEGAAIKVKSGASVIFSGTGTLTADGSACKNGIKGGETASVTVGNSADESFTLNVRAANNALASDGYLTINGGNVNVESADDGIKASPDEDDTESAGVLTINSGNITVNAADDAIHGDSEVNINGGDLVITAGDDALKAEYVLNVGTQGGYGPTIAVESSNEGFEGATVNLWAGNGRIRSSDDGINAANSDLTGYSYQLNICGGNWYINADGDGLDSNGDINVSGGYTEVFGSSMGDNAALDYGDNGCSFNVTGGTLIGVGMSQMSAVPTSGRYVIFGGTGGMGGLGGQRPSEMPDGEQPPEMPEGQQPAEMKAEQQSVSGTEMIIEVSEEKTDEESAVQIDIQELPEDETAEKADDKSDETAGDAAEIITNSEQMIVTAEDDTVNAEQIDRPDGGQGMRPDDRQGGSDISISAGDSLEIRDASGNVLYSGTAVKSANSVVFSSEQLGEGTYYPYINGQQTAEAASAEGQQQGGQQPAERPDGEPGQGQPDGQTPPAPQQKDDTSTDEQSDNSSSSQQTEENADDQSEDSSDSRRSGRTRSSSDSSSSSGSGTGRSSGTSGRSSGSSSSAGKSASSGTTSGKKTGSSSSDDSNPHTGLAVKGGIVLIAAAVLIVSRKRR